MTAAEEKHAMSSLVVVDEMSPEEEARPAARSPVWMPADRVCCAARG